jgi:hypothetical protein
MFTKHTLLIEIDVEMGVEMGVKIGTSDEWIILELSAQP